MQVTVPPAEAHSALRTWWQRRRGHMRVPVTVPHSEARSALRTWWQIRGGRMCDSNNNIQLRDCLENHITRENKFTVARVKVIFLPKPRKCPPRLRLHMRRAVRLYVRQWQRHTNEFASSPSSCAESSAHICGQHTHVSASYLHYVRRHCRRALRASAGCTCMCPPRLSHHVRRALRASAGGTRKCRPRLRQFVRRALRASANSQRKCPPRLWRHMQRVMCACTCGSGALLQAVHARVRLVSATKRGEHGPHGPRLRAAHPYPPRICHHLR